MKTIARQRTAQWAKLEAELLSEDHRANIQDARNLAALARAAMSAADSVHSNLGSRNPEQVAVRIACDRVDCLSQLLEMAAADLEQKIRELVRVEAKQEKVA